MGNDFDDFNDEGSSSDEPFEPDFSLEDSDIEFGKCPQCKEESFDLELVGDFMKLSLIESGVELKYDSVCPDCINTFSSQVTHIGKLKAEQKQRMEILLAKWNNKINFLKTGRSLMSQKIYPEAQKYFEEYIEVLEAVFNNGNEGIKPLMISEDHRRHESTILCHLLWDLIYIYDQYEPGTVKLQHTCNKLCEFLPYARGQGAVITKIRKHLKKAKHKSIIKTLLKKSQNIKSGCFIATAVFDEPYSVELTVLRNFRDQTLKKFKLGRFFIFYYYKYSPAIAKKIRSTFILKLPTKYCLKIISFFLIKLKY